MKRIRIITGHFGSGKSEYAVNLALRLREEGKKVSLADLDIVNPYFRSFEQSDLLKAHGVDVIVSSCGGRIDLPAIPAEVLRIFTDESSHGIIDLGGDPSGAHLLGRYARELEKGDFEFLMVLNANRPETKDVESAKLYLEAIEISAGQKITGIVNNTHLCAETDAEQCVKGAALAKALSEETGLPVIHHVVEKRFEKEVREVLGEEAPLFPIDILMKKPWEIF